MFSNFSLFVWMTVGSSVAEDVLVEVVIIIMFSSQMHICVCSSNVVLTVYMQPDAYSVKFMKFGLWMFNMPITQIN